MIVRILIFAHFSTFLMLGTSESTLPVGRDDCPLTIVVTGNSARSARPGCAVGDITRRIARARGSGPTPSASNYVGR